MASRGASVGYFIDRTVKQYIGGKQARPDSGYSFPVYAANGDLVGEAPLGNRKDIRNAVEAARAASKWAKNTAHGRAQVLYFIAENMVQRRAEIVQKLAAFVGQEQAAIEFKLTGEVLFRVEDFSPDEVLEELGLEDPFELTGLYQGVDIGRRSVFDPSPQPSMVFLYRRPILDEWAERGDIDLEELVAHVLVHEIGHHFGLSDAQIAAIEAG